jgi:hypothetical protein
MNGAMLSAGAGNRRAGGGGGIPAPTNCFDISTHTGDATYPRNFSAPNVDMQGGLLWTKRYGASEDHYFEYLNSGSYYQKYADTNDAVTTPANLTISASQWTQSAAAGSTSDYAANVSAATYVNYMLADKQRFMRRVFYTGTGSAQTIAHNLGCEVGMMLVYRLTGSSSMQIYHRSMDATNPEHYARTNIGFTSRSANTALWNDTLPTSTHFTVGSSSGTNQTGVPYVAFIFANDAGAGSIIKCGGYTGTGNASPGSNPQVTLGFQPDFLMIGNALTNNVWPIFDTSRTAALSGADSYVMFSSTTQGSAERVGHITNGFEVLSTDSTVNTSGDSYLYVAIKKA